MRNIITQRTVDRNRSKRPVNTPTEELYSDDDNEPCGLACFKYRIRATRIPRGFKLTSESVKFDGT